MCCEVLMLTLSFKLYLRDMYINSHRIMQNWSIDIKKYRKHARNRKEHWPSWDHISASKCAWCCCVQTLFVFIKILCPSCYLDCLTRNWIFGVSLLDCFVLINCAGPSYVWRTWERPSRWIKRPSGRVTKTPPTVKAVPRSSPSPDEGSAAICLHSFKDFL